MPGSLYFDDYSVGQKFSFGDRVITEEEIIAFAKEFDPQPMHIDPVAAKEGMMGGLIASGWHVSSLALRFTIDELFQETSLGSPGIDEIQWRRAVRPGDRLTMEAEVLDMRASTSKPDRGFVRFRFDLYREGAEGKRERAMTYKTPVMVRRRGD